VEEGRKRERAAFSPLFPKREKGGKEMKVFNFDLSFPAGKKKEEKKRA